MIIRAFLMLSFLFSAFATPSLASKKPPALDDIFGMKKVTSVAISADARYVAFTVATPSPSGYFYDDATEMTLLDLETETVSTIASGASVFTMAWSPVDNTLAYLADTQGEGVQLWRYDVGADAPKRFGAAKPSASTGQPVSLWHFTWSPDGKKIAYMAMAADLSTLNTRKTPPKTVIYGEDEQASSGGGFASADALIGTLDVRSGKSARHTPASISPMWLDERPELSWCPDNRRIVFSGWEGEYVDLEKAMAAVDVFEVDIRTDETRKIVETPGPEIAPVCVDQSVAFIGAAAGKPEEALRSIYIQQQDAQTAESFIEDVYGRADLDVLPKRRELLLATLISANRELYLADISTSDLTPVSPAGMYVVDYSVAADEDTAALILSSADAPPEIYVGSLRQRSFRKVTDLYKRERESLALARVDRVQWPSKDGRYTIDGFLIKPADFDPGKKYPLLVNIHGGPAADFPNDFHKLRFNLAFHSQLEHYAAEGFLILNPNHRGGATYGAEFREALVENFTASFDLDVDPGVDYLISKGFVDEDRIALMGASYGGYATAWGVARTDRYAAASVNDSMFNLYGHYFFFSTEFYKTYFRGTPFDRLEAYLEASPLYYAENISTPMLLRCGLEPKMLLTSSFCTQSVEFHTALREIGTPVELLVHPYEGHGIFDRETAANYLVQNVDWFRFWMDGVEDPDPAKRAQYERWRALRSGAKER